MIAGVVAALCAACGVSYMALQHGGCFDLGSSGGGRKPSTDAGGSRDAEGFEALRSKVPLHEVAFKDEEGGVVTYLMCCDHCLKVMRGQNGGGADDERGRDGSLVASVTIFDKCDFSRVAVKELHLCSLCRQEFMSFLRDFMHVDSRIPIGSFCFESEGEQALGRGLESGR